VKNIIKDVLNHKVFDYELRTDSRIILYFLAACLFIRLIERSVFHSPSKGFLPLSFFAVAIAIKVAYLAGRKDGVKNPQEEETETCKEKLPTQS